MIESMNIPYVKQFDQNGQCINEIKRNYINNYPNRKERRMDMQKDRFYGESKNVHMTINGTSKYYRIKQRVPLFEFRKVDNKKEKWFIGAKTIMHYVLK